MRCTIPNIPDVCSKLKNQKILEVSLNLSGNNSNLTSNPSPIPPTHQGKKSRNVDKTKNTGKCTAHAKSSTRIYRAP